MNWDLFHSWIGTPYEGWTPGDNLMNRDEPYWTRDGPLPSVLPSCNCVGFLNLVRRSVGLSAIGGTVEWWHAFEREAFDPAKTYPVGTLFLAPYVDPDDDGHVAIQGPKGLLHSIRAGGLVCQEFPDWSWFSAQVPPEKWIVPGLEKGPQMLDYEFLYALEGAPHAVQTGHWSITLGPHWAIDDFLPSPTLVHRQGCTKAGVGNLARRSAGLCAIGSESSWWGAYALSGELYRAGTHYPTGTLFLRAYRGDDDPGNLGILTPRGILHSTSDRGVVLEPETRMWEMVVLPEHWLTTSA